MLKPRIQNQQSSKKSICVINERKISRSENSHLFVQLATSLKVFKRSRGYLY
uniref:Uncharacterized protein n=1 Tax=Rhizophora mucronata TaxID=61149 RepID=A0A2P2JE62_RHIMU